jgi:hypothetical protein
LQEANEKSPMCSTVRGIQNDFRDVRENARAWISRTEASDSKATKFRDVQWAKAYTGMMVNVRENKIERQMGRRGTDGAQERERTENGLP